MRERAGTVNTRGNAARSTASDAAPATADVTRDRDGAMIVRLAGDWRLGGTLPAVEPVVEQLRGTWPSTVRFDASALGAWDTGLLTFLDRLETTCGEREVPVERGTLPDGVTRLLDLAHAVPSRTGLDGEKKRAGLLERTGVAATALLEGGRAIVTFTGQLAQALGRLVTGRARFRWVDLGVFLQDTGAAALPIVTLISFLVGVILAFVGAVQLKQFGAQIYVADLVGLAMVRQMGALMAAIIMAGRTGAAFAAQLGAMKVNEEIDALSTMGLEPVRFLVVPRVLAAVAVVPALTLLTNFAALLGGLLVFVQLGFPAVTFVNRVLASVTMADFLTGMGKAVVFGVLVAAVGCLRGIQTGTDAQAVGASTTSAVVSGIVLIAVTDGLFAVVFYVLGI